MEKIKVGVIFGGQSTEHDVSVVSGSSVIKNLNKEKYEIYPIYISEKGEWFHYIKPVQDIEIFEIGEQPKELEKISNEFETLTERSLVLKKFIGSFRRCSVWRRRNYSGVIRIAKSSICWM